MQDVAAVSLPDSIKGEQLVLCVSAAELPAPGLPALLAARVEHALGKPFRPGAVHVLVELPRTRNGKVMRRLVRNLRRGLPPGDVSALENPSALEALQSVAKQS